MIFPRTAAQRRREFFLHSVFSKTGGHCHFCGDRLRFDNRGFSEEPRGHWEVDHVVQRGKGGYDDVANYLPACTTCNRLRWNWPGPELQLRLLMGNIAVREMNRGSKLGEELSSLLDRRLAENEGRRVPGATRRRMRARARRHS
jgi:hypothetical protein